MGASFNDYTFKASDEKTLRSSFQKLQDNLCLDHGSDSYAGHLGIARGLQIVNKSFKTTNEAHEYVVEQAEKWGSALAVKVGDFSKAFPVTATEKKEVEKLNELQQKYDGWESELISRVKQSKSALRGCKKCESKIAVKYVKEAFCPVCGDHHFIQTETDTKNYEALRIKLKAQKEKVTTLSKKYEEQNKKNVWYVGAWCAD
jgi:hypothetical protein